MNVVLMPRFLTLVVFVLPVLAQTEVQLASRAMDEFARVCEADGKLLWNQSLCGRLVLVNPGTRVAIANGPDPGGKFHAEGTVFVGTFPDQFTPSNTAIQWKDQEWSTVMLPLPLDPFIRLGLLAHESFHRLQPHIRLNGSDTPNAHLDTEAGRLWLRLELRALSRALRESGPAGRQSATDAMLFRMYRNKLCAGSQKLEVAMEKQEGLAEYSGYFIAKKATHEDIGRIARIVESFEDSNAFARSFAYYTGPALGFLLDRYATGWRARAANEPLDSMLKAALGLRPRLDLEQVAQERAQFYGFLLVAAAEREREERHQAMLGELKKKFFDGPTLDFPNAPEMNRNFNPQNLVPFPPHGVYYPTGTFFANWGRLRVESNGALVAPDSRSLKVPGPVKMEGAKVRGDGWELTLSEGWTIQPSPRNGSSQVAQAPTPK